MKYDLNIMGDPRTSEVLMKVDNTAIQGPQKLLQRMVLLMFTDSRIPTNLDAGTEVAQDEVINISDIEVVRNTYNIALASVKDTILLETPRDADPSETLKDAQLQVKESEERGKVEITIIVTTQSGESADTTLPVDVIPEQEDGN